MPVVRSRKARDRTTGDLLRNANKKTAALWTASAPPDGSAPSIFYPFTGGQPTEKQPQSGRRCYVVRSLKSQGADHRCSIGERGKKSRLASQDQEGRGVHAYALPKGRERSGDDLLRRSNEKKNSRLPSLVQTGAPQKAGERLCDDLFDATKKRNGGRSLPKNGRDLPAIISR